MKKKLLLLLPVFGILAYVLLCSYAEGPDSFGNIDGTGATTASGCYGGGCHTHATATTVALELDTVTGGIRTTYVPGGLYKIKITGTNTGSGSPLLPRFGFQLAVVNSANAGTSLATNAGTLSATGLPPSSHYVPAGTTTVPVDIIEHDAAIVATTGTGATGTTYVESIPWTAPATGAGPIKIYGAINAVNFDGGSGGDAANNANVTIQQYVAPITGTFTVCANANTPLADVTPGGTWSSGSPAVASVNGSGLVHGVAASGGTAVITYSVLGSTVTATVTVAPLAVPGTISGPFFICSPSVGSYTASVAGGVWSSTSDGSITTAGVLSVVASGSDTVKYTVTNSCGSQSATKVVGTGIPPVVSAISGASSVCTGATIPLTDDSTGGTWSSSHAAIASVNPGSGVVTGVAVGLDTITYKISNFCGTASVTATVLVNPSPVAGTITGGSSVCLGSTLTLADGATGGTWSSTSTDASVNSGTVNPLSPGIDTIEYTVTTSCGTAIAIHPITISAPPDAGAISGITVICQGVQDTLTETVTGGTWSSSDSLIASVNASGIVTGVSGGTVSIPYSVTNGCGTAATSIDITVNSLPFTGTISGSSLLCTGSVDSFTETVSGGVWSSSNSAVTITSTGVVTAVSPGVDTIMYAVTGSCGTADAIDIIAVSGSFAAGAITGVDTNICVGHPVIIHDTIPAGTWTISNGNAIISTGVDSTVLLGVTPGIDTVFYTVIGACGPSSAELIINVQPETFCFPSAVNTVASAAGIFKVYPNPSNGSFTIDIPHTGSTATVTVVDMLGKLITTKDVAATQTPSASVNLNNMPAGNYIIKVASGDKTYREKVTIW